MEIKKLIGKTIKNIDDSCLGANGCLIKFTDGTTIVLRTTEYQEGGYNDTKIEEYQNDNKTKTSNK